LATRKVEIERKRYSQSIKIHSVCLSLTLPGLLHLLGKSAGADKKLFKQLESKYSFDISSSSFSPDDRHLNNVVSPFGPLDQAASRKTLFYLLATLNAAFPDYDFSEVRPDQFSKQISTQMVINSVNTTLFNLGNDVIVNRYR
jgi:hypothetical protein